MLLLVLRCSVLLKATQPPMPNPSRSTCTQIKLVDESADLFVEWSNASGGIMRHFKLVISLLATSLMTTHALAQSVPMPDTWDRILGFLDWFSDELTEDEIRQNAQHL